MKLPEHGEERLSRLLREETATGKAIRKAFHEEQERHAGRGVSAQKFVVAAALATALVGLLKHPQWSAPYLVNAFLGGSVVGIFFAFVTRLLNSALERAVFSGKITKGAIKTVIIAVFGGLFMLCLAALICTAFWVADQTACRCETYVWQWIADWLR